MKKDILIHADQDILNRIELSSGTQLTEKLNGKTAAPGTFIPKAPWRKPSNEEQNILFATANDKPQFQSVGLVTMPAELKRKWQSLNIEDAVTETDIQVIMSKTDYPFTLEATKSWVSQYQSVKEDMIVHRLACIDKGLTTVTYHPHEKRYLGLHLDSWEKQPLSELHQVRNRFCINLGRDIRYFLFVNLQIGKLQELTNQPRESRPRKLIQDFLAQYPDYPVIRIPLQPFEAYIAPTENIIHDGSSLHQRYQDVQITFRSFFGVRPVSKTKPSLWKRLFSKIEA